MLNHIDQEPNALNNLTFQKKKIAFAIIFLLIMFGIFSAIITPYAAFYWKNHPYTGFLLEPTLVITDIKTQQWGGVQDEIRYSLHVLRIADKEVDSIETYNQILSNHRVGDYISITTLSQEGIVRIFPEHTLTSFAPSDFITLFWLPYSIGLVFLICAIWIYKINERTATSYGLILFFTLTSIVCFYLFDLYTTHIGSTAWVISLAFLGGSLFFLASVFPNKLQWFANSPGIRISFFLISAALAVWGVVAIKKPSTPWDYYQNWFMIYRYIGIGIALFFIKMILASFRNPDKHIRIQARAVLLGISFGLLPIMIFFLSPVFGIETQFKPIFLLPSLIAFPVSILISISRYQLLKSESLFNRTLVFGIITTTLAGLFPALIKLFQEIFFSITGEKNEASIVLTTFILASLIEPIKRFAQKFITGNNINSNNSSDLNNLQDKLRDLTYLFDIEKICKDALACISNFLGVKSAAISLIENDNIVKTISIGRWPSVPSAYFPIISRDIQLGVLYIGKKDDKRIYQEEEIRSTIELVNQIGQAIFFSKQIQKI